MIKIDKIHLACFLQLCHNINEPQGYSITYHVRASGFFPRWSKCKVHCSRQTQLCHINKNEQYTYLMCSCSLMIHHNINQLKYAIPSKSICFSHMLTTLSIHLFVFTYSTHTLSEKKKKKEKGKKKKGKKRLQHESFAYGLPLHYSVSLLAA